MAPTSLPLLLSKKCSKLVGPQHNWPTIIRRLLSVCLSYIHSFEDCTCPGADRLDFGILLGTIRYISHFEWKLIVAKVGWSRYTLYVRLNIGAMQRICNWCNRERLSLPILYPRFLVFFFFFCREPLDLHYRTVWVWNGRARGHM
jgi:hypothetical protein